MTATPYRLGCVFLVACFVQVAVGADLDRAKLRKQLIFHEGRKTKVYNDSEGIPTIGVGFNLKRADAKKQIENLTLDYKKVLAGDQALTDTQIDTLLDADIDTAISSSKSVFPKFTDLSDVRQRVLVDMMFNLGKSKFEVFKDMIAAVKAGKYNVAADEMKDSKWYKQVKDRGPRLETMMRTDTDPNKW